MNARVRVCAALCARETTQSVSVYNRLKVAAVVFDLLFSGFLPFLLSEKIGNLVRDFALSYP